MIVGNPSVFAIESHITEAYVNPGWIALGSFVIHLSGFEYGVKRPDATMLACSLDEVNRRIEGRGAYTASFSSDLAAASIADGLRIAQYEEASDLGHIDRDTAEAVKHFQGSIDSLWAPDGDEAFDDGSYVLHFDVEEGVRLIGFRCGQNGLHVPASLKDVPMSAEQFYETLKGWRDRFLIEWEELPKVF